LFVSVDIDYDDDRGDDDYFEDEDMFSRLEELRAKLENELGCDKFLKAYRTVKVPSSVCANNQLTHNNKHMKQITIFLKCARNLHRI